MKTLINLSGGLDSTYVVWHYLTNNPSEQFLIHHCKLDSNQNRADAEQRAVGKILNWLKKNGVTNFEYFETQVSFRGPSKLYDFNAIAWINAQMLQLENFDSIERIIVCQNADDVLMTPFKDFVEHYANIGKPVGFPVSKTRTEITFEYPIKKTKKKDIADMLPPELRGLAWYCTTPESKRGIPQKCGQCNTCKQIKLKRYLIIHQTSGNENEKLKNIFHMHAPQYKMNNGKGRTFYQYIIDREGQTHKQHRSLNDRGKALSIDIAVMGDYREGKEKPSKKILKALHKLIKELEPKTIATIPHSRIGEIGLAGTAGMPCPGKLLEYLREYNENT